MTNEASLKRLRWGCRRGMLELDAILLPFFDEHYHKLSKDEQQSFEALLSCVDQQLWEWLLGIKQPDDAKFAALVEKIRAHAKNHP